MNNNLKETKKCTCLWSKQTNPPLISICPFNFKYFSAKCTAGMRKTNNYRHCKPCSQTRMTSMTVDESLFSRLSWWNRKLHFPSLGGIEFSSNFRTFYLMTSHYQPRPQGILPARLQVGENGPRIGWPILQFIGLFKNALIPLQYTVYSNNSIVL
jgi:hypothetical protein